MSGWERESERQERAHPFAARAPSEFYRSQHLWSQGPFLKCKLDSMSAASNHQTDHFTTTRSNETKLLKRRPATKTRGGTDIKEKWKFARPSECVCLPLSRHKLFTFRTVEPVRDADIKISKQGNCLFCLWIRGVEQAYKSKKWESSKFSVHISCRKKILLLKRRRNLPTWRRNNGMLMSLLRFGFIFLLKLGWVHSKIYGGYKQKEWP